ncbi:mechanosensitive ion channel [Fulvivirga kasyanovii]|uniref:Mechanosensitive ion channel n=1 Tax=Fulvivirga kasyanovii TaxID=396812 RepID=A0ABW9RUP8_9BACT|nr:mechanosensitive ion channel [Fulvivirga kasyanovii]
MKKIIILYFLLFACYISGFAQKQNDTVPKAVVVVSADSLEVKVVEGDSAKTDQAEGDNGVVEDVKGDLPQISKIISLGKIFWTLVFILVGFVLVRFLGSVLEKLAEKSTNYRITIKGLVPVVKISTWLFIIFIIIAGIFQPKIATVLAVTASIGIAVGFAAQDILKNVFGGIMILFDRPFQVGDKIEAGEYYGEVVEIGLRSTRIVTPDDSLVSIPNGELMNKSVSNSNSGAADCQVVAEIYLPITVDTESVRQVAIEAAQVSRFIYLNKPIVVLFFNEVKERRSYLKMRLKAYVSDIRNEFAFKSDMTEIVMRELLRNKLIDPEDLK